MKILATVKQFPNPRLAGPDLDMACTATLERKEWAVVLVLIGIAAWAAFIG